MKRVVEVKRGDPVPSWATWLESVIKTEYGEWYKVSSGDGGVSHRRDKESVTYDVYEVNEPGQERPYFFTAGHNLLIFG